MRVGMIECSKLYTDTVLYGAATMRTTQRPEHFEGIRPAAGWMWWHACFYAACVSGVHGESDAMQPR
jgi:hypothetical protein